MIYNDKRRAAWCCGRIRGAANVSDGPCYPTLVCESIGTLDVELHLYAPQLRTLMASSEAPKLTPAISTNTQRTKCDAMTERHRQTAGPRLSADITTGTALVQSNGRNDSQRRSSPAQVPMQVFEKRAGCYGSDVLFLQDLTWRLQVAPACQDHVP